MTMTQNNLRRTLGVFVVHALDILHQAACCPRCCAPCSEVKALMNAGVLDVVVREAPEHLWQGSEWWVDGEGVDHTWLRSQWTGCLNGHGGAP